MSIRNLGCGVLVLCGFIITGCGGGGGGDGDGDGGGSRAPTQNISVVGATVVTATPQIGRSLELAVTLGAREPSTDLGVIVYAALKSDVDRDTAGPLRQYLLGASSVPNVPAGGMVHEFKLNVPANVEPGEYYIVAAVDDANAIEETDESDNSVRVVSTLEKPVIVNVLIENVFLESPTVMLDLHTDERHGPGDEYAADATATIELAVEGAEVPVGIEVFAKMRFTRKSDGGVFDLPLLIWDSGDLDDPNAVGGYSRENDPCVNVPFVGEVCLSDLGDQYAGDIKALADAASALLGVDNPLRDLLAWYSIGTIEPQLVEVGTDDVDYKGLERRSVHLDLYMPGKKTLQEVLDGIPQVPFVGSVLSRFANDAVEQYFGGITRETFENGGVTACILIEVRPAGNAEDSNAADNVRCIEVEVVPPAKPRPGNVVYAPEFRSGYVSGWDSEYFGFGLDFDAQATADQRGLVITGSGSVPVKAFGVESEFLGVEARAQLLPAYEGRPIDETPGFDLEVRFNGLTLYEHNVDLPEFTVGCIDGALTPGTGPDDVCKFSKSLAEGERTFYGFLYPITVAGGLTGNIGVDYGVTMRTNALEVICEPYVSLEGWVSAGVDFGLFEAGAEGSITILEERFKISEAATLSIVSDGTGGGEVDIGLTPQLTVANEITGASGKLGAWCSYSEPAWCRSGGWWPFWYPCLRTVRLSVDLVSWNGFKREDALLERSTFVRFIKLQDGTTEYRDK